MPLAQLSAGFQSLPPLPTSKLGPSGADSWVGEFVYVLEPCGCGYLQWTLLWGWGFLLPPQPPQVFSVRGFEALFPCAGTLGCVVWLTPQLFLPFYPHANVGLPAAALSTQSSNHCIAVCSLCPSCSSLPLLPAWMNVSSLIPLLPDFHTVWFLVIVVTFCF